MIDYNVENECEMLVTHKNQAARYFFDNDSQKQTRYWSIYELDDCFCVYVSRIREKTLIKNLQTTTDLSVAEIIWDTFKNLYNQWIKKIKGILKFFGGVIVICDNRYLL